MPPWGALFVPAELDASTLELLCELLTRTNYAYLLEHPRTPPLYQSGVWYEEETGYGPEKWYAIPHVLTEARRGLGADCKRLAAWRAAELRVAGEHGARCVWSAYPEPGRLLIHIRVERANGVLEDPSAELGMRTHQARPFTATRPMLQMVAGAPYPWNL